MRRIAALLVHWLRSRLPVGFLIPLLMTSNALGACPGAPKTPPLPPAAGYDRLYTTSLKDGAVIACVAARGEAYPGYLVQKKEGVVFESLAAKFGGIKSAIARTEAKIRERKKRRKSLTTLKKQLTGQQKELNQLNVTYTEAYDACKKLLS